MLEVLNLGKFCRALVLCSGEAWLLPPIKPSAGHLHARDWRVSPSFNNVHPQYKQLVVHLMILNYCSEF